MTAEWLKELWRYRELLYFFAWRDVKIRYKQALLGASWAVLQPLLTMAIFTVIFGRIAHVPSDGIPYPAFIFCALVPWTYFASTLTLASNSLVANTTLITKVYFPRVLLPAASAASGMVDFGISSILLACLLTYYGVGIGWVLLFIPAAVLVMIILAVSVSMLFAALNVRYRDVKYVIPFLVQVWLFLTPVIYPPSSVPKRYKALVALNPMSGVVEAFRSCLFPSYRADLSLLVTSLVVTILLLIIAIVYFQRTEREFADII